MAKYSLPTMIAEARRELDKRPGVYQRLVAKREISQGEADMKIAIMASIVATLEHLYKHEEDWRALIAAKKEATS